VVTLCWLLLGFAFVQRESRRLAFAFFAFATLEPAFLTYKLIAMKLDNSTSDDQLDQREYPVFSWNEFLLTGCLAVVVRLACIVYGVLCMRNFGLGLLQKMWLPSSSAAGVGQSHTLVHSPQHAQEAQSDHIGQPVVVVREFDSHQDRSLLRTYIQPLL
jgi:hypothetical protein